MKKILFLLAFLTMCYTSYSKPWISSQPIPGIQDAQPGAEYVCNPSSVQVCYYKITTPYPPYYATYSPNTQSGFINVGLGTTTTNPDGSTTTTYTTNSSTIEVQASTIGEFLEYLESLPE